VEGDRIGNPPAVLPVTECKFGYVATSDCRIAARLDRAPYEKNEMKTSTAAVPDQSLPPRAGLGVLQPPASAPSNESAGERSSLSALLDAKLAADREIQRLSARVHQLSAQLAAADEHARRSLAQDLHDDAGSALTAARFALARIETWLPGDAPAPCAEALDIARQSLDAACEANHRAVAGLHAPSFDGGVGRALADWTARFAAGTSLRVAFACSADERLAQLPDATALAVFRVAQEALNNVARHARATEVAVSIDADARFLTLVVTDDGIGMTAAARAKRGRFGLSGMRARCDALGGSLRVTTAKAGGTAVRARFPLTTSPGAVSALWPALRALNS
jgi:two-component system, NarL family, sensor histidine kinase UhpB